MRRCVLSRQDASAHDNWTALDRTAEFDILVGRVPAGVGRGQWGHRMSASPCWWLAGVEPLAARGQDHPPCNQTVRLRSAPEMCPIMHDTTTTIRGFARSHQLSDTGLPYLDVGADWSCSKPRIAGMRAAAQ